MRLSLIFAILIVIKCKVQQCYSAPQGAVEISEITSHEIDDSQKFRESYTQRMKSFMNTTVDPCDDFYAYACGNYPNITEDNDIDKKLNTLVELSHASDGLIDEILQKERQQTDEYYDELQIVKKYLNICDSATLWPALPSDEYLNVLKSIGGIPALDPSWNASEFDWFNMTAHLIRFGAVGLVKEEIFLKHPFPPYYEIPRFGFDFDVYSGNIETTESYGYSHNYKIMKELLELYGVNGTQAEEVINDIIDFWKETLVFQDQAVDRKSCRKLELLDGEDDYEFPKWEYIFEIAWNADNLSIFEFSDCPCDWYFKKVDEVSARRPVAMANYLALKFLYTMHSQLKSSKFQHTYCINQIKKSVPLIFSHFYMKEHFNKQVQTEVEEMIVQLKESFIELIETSDWLDSESRIGNKIMINTLKTNVGAVVDPISAVYIGHIKKLNLKDNFAENNLELAKFRTDMRHYAYMQPNLHNNTAPLDVLNAIQVNAFYSVINHKMYALAGILFPPMYHEYLPISVKYGGIGYIVGHEIVHSLDYRGREFETFFNRYSAYTEASAKMVANRSKCFADQHLNYTVPVLGIQVNRTKNLSESIADAGGLREAFDTYRKIYKAAMEREVKEFERTQALPGLDLTQDQIFFLSFAQIYCAKYEPRHYWSEIYEDHPMDRYRVIAPLQNFEEFSKTFNCSLGIAMNPTRKCRLW